MLESASGTHDRPRPVRRGAGRPACDLPANTPSGAFGADLINEIMPMVEKRYRFSLFADHNNRALVGLSMGAGQRRRSALRALICSAISA
jgi:hypothetical protein